MNLSEYNRAEKNRVRFVKVPFDQEIMWKTIKSKMRKEKQRRTALIFFCFFVLGAVGTYIYNQTYFKLSDVFVHSFEIEQNKGGNDKKAILYQDQMAEDKFINKSETKLQQFQKFPSFSKTKVVVKRTKEISHSITSAQDSNIFVFSNQLSDPDIQNRKIIDLADSERLIPEIKILRFDNKDHLINKPISMPLKKYKNIHQNIFVFAGIGIVNRTLKPLDNQKETVELINIKEDSEKVLEQISVGIDYTHIFASKFTLTLGAEYRHITEKVFYDYKVREVFGDYSNFRTSKITSYQYRYYNDYRFIDIRTAMGYVVNTRKVNMFFEAGVSYSFYNSFGGVMLSNDEKPKEFKTSHNNNLFHLNIHTSIDYKLSDQWSLSLSPSVSFGLQYFSPGDQPIGQKYDIISIRIGAKRTLY